MSAFYCVLNPLRTTSELRARLARRETSSSTPLKYFTDLSTAVRIVNHFSYFFLVFARVCLLMSPIMPCGDLLGKG